MQLVGQLLMQFNSDADALIESLETLIEKKYRIKQGAMQELLTGKKRLPDFSGEWVQCTAGDIGSFRGGSGFPTKYQGDVSGAYPFYKVSDMNNDGNETYMSDSNNWISEDIKKIISATVFPIDTIIFAKVGAAIFLERKKILSTPGCIDNNLAGYILDLTKVDVRFIHYVLLNIKFGALVNTTALPSLSGTVLSEIALLLPSKPEQIAISKILSDMDSELFELETKHTKARQIKQGMMQELLTGKIRLV